jgi:hypothetical protein
MIPKLTLERVIEKQKELIAEYNRLEEICNNRESQYQNRSSLEIARRMLEVMDDLKDVESLIEVYKKRLEEKK